MDDLKRGNTNPNKDKKPNNPDPITGAPGSHPVGVGVGAAAGGAVPGGLGGKAAAEHFNPTDERYLDRYLDYDVVDRDGEKIGTLHCMWSDHTGEAAFLGVHTGWLFGRTHVVPAQGVEVNEARHHLRLPYSTQKVKDAPSYEQTAEMTEDKEQEVYRYYGVGTPQAVPTETKGAKPTASGESTHQEHPGPSTPEQATIQLSEEQLKVGTRSVEAGGVRLRKVVRTKTVNQPVEVAHEEIVIERVPASEAHEGRQKTFNEQEVYIPLRRDEVVVQKETRLKEEVRARKYTRKEQQNISEQVRSEDVEVQEKGGAQRNYPKGDSPAQRMREREEKPRSERLGKK
jgi:uncharacterized protein (TIGR02271 family)